MSTPESLPLRQSSPNSDSDEFRRPIELGKSFAARKIEVASLAIRATTAEHVMLSFSDAARLRQRRRNDHTLEGAESMLAATRSILANTEPSTPPSPPRKTVTFGPPIVYEIIPITPENDSAIAESADELELDPINTDEPVDMETNVSDEAPSEDETEENGTQDVMEDSAAVVETQRMTNTVESSMPLFYPAYTSKMASERKCQRITRDDLLTKLGERRQHRPEAPRTTWDMHTVVQIDDQLTSIMNKTRASLESTTSSPPLSTWSVSDLGHHDNESVPLSAIPGSSDDTATDADDELVLSGKTYFVRSIKPAATSSSSCSSSSAVPLTPICTMSVIPEWRDSLGSEDSDATTLTSSSAEDVALSTPLTKTVDVRLTDFGRSLLHEFERITCDTQTVDDEHDSYSKTTTPTPRSISDYNIRAPTPHVPENVNVPDCGSQPQTYTDETPSPKQMDASVSSVDFADTESMEKVTTGKGRLYLKIIAAENLDFPVDDDAPDIRCVFSDGLVEYASAAHHMEHTIYFDHEMQVDQVNVDHEFTLTLHACPRQSTSGMKRLWNSSSLLPRTSRMARYVNSVDGAIAQARVTFNSIEAQCRLQICTVSFALVNGWYRSRSSLLLAKSRKDKVSIPEKAVGKITAQLFYIPDVAPTVTDLPQGLVACEHAQNMQRFHSTCWHKGYMSQLGDDVKYWRRRFFTLQGGRLYSYSDTTHALRGTIDLSSAVVLAKERYRVLVDLRKQPHRKLSGQKLLTDLDGMMDHDDTVSSVRSLADEGDLSISVKNGFQIVFEDGKTVEFSCDSTEERERWLDILKTMIGRIPPRPSWFPCAPLSTKDSVSISTSFSSC